jgi:hypothetical protein
MNKRFLIVFLLGIVGISIAARLLPHPPNFTPIAALALFAGVYASKVSKWYLLLPLGVMLVSDLFIGFYEWRVMAMVYGSFFAIGFMGLFLRMFKARLYTAMLGAILGSILFYLTTNFAVWAFTGMYSPTLDGLMLSYAMAIPFFKFTVLGNALYVGLFFGIYEFASNLSYKHAYGTATAKTGSN